MAYTTIVCIGCTRETIVKDVFTVSDDTVCKRCGGDATNLAVATNLYEYLEIKAIRSRGISEGICIKDIAVTVREILNNTGSQLSSFTTRLLQPDKFNGETND